jgi:hypothetical protein
VAVKLKPVIPADLVAMVVRLSSGDTTSSI